MYSVLVVGFLSSSGGRADDWEFVAGINFGGPPLSIDGRAWEGTDSPRYRSNGKSFENQAVSLIPPTDAARATMIRSSLWGDHEITLIDLAPGRYALTLYLWEDNNPETFTIRLGRRVVSDNVNSGAAGQWSRLGPWPVRVTDGTIRLTSQGGAANFSGLEIWRITTDDAPLATPDDLAFFESRIRPLLITHCYDCHSEESGTAESGLFLDSRAGLLQGGRSGPSVQPGDARSSLLLRAVRQEDEHLRMPPDEPLTSAQIADLERWVSLGLPDPRDGTPPDVSFDWEAARQFWSFRPVTDPPAPPVREPSWPATSIDRFILAKLDSVGLTPVAAADKRTWLRRATLDLTGLPPTPDEIDQFLDDESPTASARVVDRLLASPRYGERWGRHWMDLVRYADTAGDNSDFPVPEAYRYRNYIIDAFNSDKPYSEFLAEQIAGDLLPSDSDAQADERLIATGYLAISRRFGSLLKNYPQHLTIEDTIDNLGRTVLGLSINCARCHDHKFDPISQDDYYGLYGILASTRYPFPGIELEPNRSDFVPLRTSRPADPELAYAVADLPGRDVALHVRGEPKNPGTIVPRRFLSVLGGQTLPDDARSGSGRLQLASWLTDPGNPLTARVIVNRVWHYHFGQGIVPTPSDFGLRGTPPTHPELLDHLASRFQDDGGSIKALHRRIMLSSVYQLSTADDPTNRTLDQDNRLRWRFDRRRLDAETLRDSMLAISHDLIEERVDRPHPFPPTEKFKYTQHHPFRDAYHSNHRSVYQMSARLNARPFLTTFDGADRNASTPKRDTSITSVQGLYFLNDAFLHDRADSLARRLVAEHSEDAARMTAAFVLTTGHPPSEPERTAANTFLARMRDALLETNDPREKGHQGRDGRTIERQAWAALGRVLFRANAFLHID